MKTLFATLLVTGAFTAAAMDATPASAEKRCRMEQLVKLQESVPLGEGLPGTAEAKRSSTSFERAIKRGLMAAKDRFINRREVRNN